MKKILKIKVDGKEKKYSIAILADRLAKNPVETKAILAELDPRVSEAVQKFASKNAAEDTEGRKWVTLTGKVISETEKAVNFESNNHPVSGWFPKSQIRRMQTRKCQPVIEIARWLFEKKIEAQA